MALGAHARPLGLRSMVILFATMHIPMAPKSIGFSLLIRISMDLRPHAKPCGLRAMGFLLGKEVLCGPRAKEFLLPTPWTSPT